MQVRRADSRWSRESDNGVTPGCDGRACLRCRQWLLNRASGIAGRSPVSLGCSTLRTAFSISYYLQYLQSHVAFTDVLPSARWGSTTSQATDPIKQRGAATMKDAVQPN